MSNPQQNRRDFLKLSGFGLLSAMIGARVLTHTSSAIAQSAPAGGKLEMVKVDDPTAKTLGYYEDAKKVDTKKWSKRAGPEGAKQFCYNCQFYITGGKDPKSLDAAPCTIFANKGVKGKGWCNSWTQNPAVKG